MFRSVLCVLALGLDAAGAFHAPLQLATGCRGPTELKSTADPRTNKAGGSNGEIFMNTYGRGSNEYNVYPNEYGGRSNRGYRSQNQGYRSQNEGYRSQNQGFRSQYQGDYESGVPYGPMADGYRPESGRNWADRYESPNGYDNGDDGYSDDPYGPMGMEDRRNRHRRMSDGYAMGQNGYGVRARYSNYGTGAGQYGYESSREFSDGYGTMGTEDRRNRHHRVKLNWGSGYGSGGPSRVGRMTTSRVPYQPSVSSRTWADDRDSDGQYGMTDRSRNYRQSPGGNYRQSPGGNYRQSPGGNYRQSPGGNYRQSPAGNNRQSPAGNYRQPPAGNNRQPPAGNYRQPPGGPGNYRQPPAGNNRQPPAGNYRQPPGGPGQNGYGGRGRNSNNNYGGARNDNY